MFSPYLLDFREFIAFLAKYSPEIRGNCDILHLLRDSNIR